MCKQAYLEKHTSCTPSSCWKRIHYVRWLWNYCTAGTSVLENIVVRNRKKYSHNKVSYNYLRATIQEDHDIHTYSLFCLVVLKFEKFDKKLVTSNL